MIVTIRGGWLLFAMLSIAACRRPAPAGVEAGSLRYYEGAGVVQSVNAAARTAIVAHEAIPNYMDAMTMPFRFADGVELSGLERGDRIRFRLAVTDAHGWIETFEKTGRVALPPPRPERGPAAPALAGRTPPDVELTGQDGRPFHLSDLRGQAVALTFIFIRCPYPEMCPRLSRQFAVVQRALLDDWPDDSWRLISVSIDPEYDTPARLAAHADSFAADPVRWTFATGSRAEVERLCAWFGVAAVRGDGAALEHNLRTAIVAPSGEVRRVFAGNEWTPEELIAELRSALDGHPERRGAERAPESKDPD